MALKSFRTNTLNTTSNINGLIHIKTVDTEGAVSFVNATDCFSADFYNYRINFNLIGSTNLQDVRARMLVDSTPDSSSNYRRQILGASATTMVPARETGQTSFRAIRIFSTSKMLGHTEIYFPFETQRTQILTFFTSAVDGNIEWGSEMASFNGTNSFNGVQFFASSGTINGKIDVFGYKAG